MIASQGELEDICQLANDDVGLICQHAATFAESDHELVHSAQPRDAPICNAGIGACSPFSDREDTQGFQANHRPSDHWTVVQYRNAGCQSKVINKRHRLDVERSEMPHLNRCLACW
jgi:hypothetical protein